MWSLLLVGLIEAAPPVVTTEVVEPIVLRTDAKRGRRRGGKKGQSTDWGHEFYARPAVGGSSYTGADGTSTTAIAIGGQGGVRYWQKKRGNPIWAGRSRAQLQYIVSSGSATGMEVRVGSFMGPQWAGPSQSYFGLSSGLDVFWNRYNFGDVALDPTVGVGMPFVASTGLKLVGVYAGFEPSWIANEDRRVDWSDVDEFGFGHQFSTFVGGQLNLGGMGVGLNYTRTVTAYGVQQGYGVSFNLSG
jgi:hypothetical protein